MIGVLHTLLVQPPLQVAPVSRREQLGTDDSQLEDKKLAKARGRGPGPAGRGRGRGRGRGGKSGVVGDEAGDQGEEHQGEELQGRQDKKRPRSEAVMKRPAAKPKAKAAKPPADLAEPNDDKEKGRNGSKRKTSEKESTPLETKKKKNTEKNKGKDGKGKTKETIEEEVGSNLKQVRSWASRWIPTEDGLPLRKMTAVRQVFETFLQPKLVGQSTLQSPFFKLCSQAFRAQGIDHEGISVEQLVACAELQVEVFLKEDAVRI